MKDGTSAGGAVFFVIVGATIGRPPVIFCDNGRAMLAPTRSVPHFSAENGFIRSAKPNASPYHQSVKSCQKENFRFVHSYKYKQMFYKTIDKYSPVY